jgi:uncharacterized protein (DUF983 family)
MQPPTTVPYRPSLPTMLWRGARRRCPWCGGRGAFFVGWFKTQERCRTCGIGWRRGYEGFELGAMTVNVIIVFGVLIVGAAIGIVVTSPGIPVVPLVVALGAVGIALPIVLYPVSYTLWQAIDLAMRPPDPADPDTPPPRR